MTEAALLSEKQEVWGFLSSGLDIFRFTKQSGWSIRHQYLPVWLCSAFIWSGQAPRVSAQTPNYLLPLHLGLQLGHLYQHEAPGRRAGLTFSLPQTVLSKSKPCFLPRIEPLQTAAYVCEVCLGFLPSAPWKEPGAGLPAGKHSLHLGASRACGRCGLVLWWLLQPPRAARGGGLRSPLPCAEMRKSNFNPQHKASKINRSAPPQIICRVLNGILLTGNARTEGIASLAY